MSELCYLSAIEMRRALLAKEVSSQELIQAHLERIEACNPQVNAIVTLVADEALAAAEEADRALARGEVLGALHGLPIAHKDLANTKGIRTTYGSPIFADFVPEENDLIVDRMQGAGAITIGKTNTPEFGAGSQTFNPVFGRTKNPYDLSKTCGGSSGGAAVALACGMMPLADGSDMGGSLRNPASFCNVVGFRPTPGVVPNYPSEAAWGTLAVQGPMARSVSDLALLLSVMAGPEARSPISRPEDPKRFAEPLDSEAKGKRIAVCFDMGEDVLFEPEVLTALEASLKHFSDMGCELASPAIDFSGAEESFRAFRAHAFAGKMYPLLEQHRDKLKDSVIWNIEEGLKLSALDLSRAEAQRSTYFARIAALMQDYDFLVLPVAQVLPFDVEQEYVSEINGQSLSSYLDWMRSCYYISALGNPAISVPAAFSTSGLPIGLQIVGGYGKDLEVLQMAYAFEQASLVGQRRPVLPNE